MSARHKSLEPFTLDEMENVDDALWVIREFLRHLTPNLDNRYSRQIHRHSEAALNQIDHLRTRLNSTERGYWEGRNVNNGLCFIKGAKEFFKETYTNDRKISSKGFVKWVTKQRDRNDPIGDLAKDVVQDIREKESHGHAYPTTYKQLREHLINSNACDGALRAFDEAWDEYKERGS
jgi:uncharacterized protein YozE (UPF0346 family)